MKSSIYPRYRLFFPSNSFSFAIFANFISEKAASLWNNVLALSFALC